ncbi:MAG: 4-deoxy-4-formamido-L-arabinose-phosphoundecaprenol deformylase [Alphaproteobacteria bacterium]|nr:4-deoxy-4-formamido-L-arabinose-phosphoundecaprenol deformylase [Alphaproteobacteria bacterium]
MTDRARLAIKIDVDTDRGTREGVEPLARVLDRHGVRGTFLFSLGPDNTGRAIKRIFRPGFFAKVSRTSVIKHYGLRTLMNGVLLPAPDIGRRNADTMRAIANAGHEVGIHCWDHIRWQDGLATMDISTVRAEFTKAREAFERIFGRPARTAGAAGWQADVKSLEVYDEASLDYASDARGTAPFRPRVGARVFRTIQMPTSLPTLDELVGRPEYPDSELVDEYLRRLVPGRLNAFTGHAELEGMHYVEWLDRFLTAVKAYGVGFTNLAVEAAALSQAAIPVADLIQGEIDGRSGTMAVQKA